MNIDEINRLKRETDEEIHEDEEKQIKKEMKDKKRVNYYRMNGMKQMMQNVKCLFGKHLFNWVPSMNITTCPCCTRIWIGRKGDK